MAIRTVRPLDDEEWEQFMGELNRDSTPEEEALMHKMIKLSKDLNLIKWNTFPTEKVRVVLRRIGTGTKQLRLIRI